MSSFVSDPSSSLVDLASKGEWDELISVFLASKSGGAGLVPLLEYKIPEDADSPDELFLGGASDDYDDDDDDDDDPSGSSIYNFDGDVLRSFKSDEGMNVLHMCCKQDAPLSVLDAASKYWRSHPPLGSITAMFNEQCSGGRTPLHLYAEHGTDPDVCKFIAYLAGEEGVQAPDHYGYIPSNVLQNRFDSGDEGAEDDGKMGTALNLASTNFSAFKKMFEEENPRVLETPQSVACELEYYKAIVLSAPRKLLAKDDEGLTLLEKARVLNKSVEVISFLEDNTARAETVESEFKVFENDEEFKDKFLLWGDL